ncbi:MAG: hypothetical protein Q9163_004509 [Psora crenata]
MDKDMASPFHVAGADTVIAVSPTRNVIHTCDPAVTTQIFRRSNFRKPAELIELLNVFGPGLTGSEGPEGRLYRKVTAPFFTEQTMDQVWNTSIESIGALMQSLVAAQQPSELLQQSERERRSLRSIMASMTLHNVFTNTTTTTTLSACAKLSYLLFQARLPPPAISGNIFAFLFAGHEANANTLTIAVFLLALHPSIQSSLQHTIDVHLANCPPKNSTYTTHYPLLKDSLVAAVINETLRLFTILPFLPKTTPEFPSSITVKGRTHVLPPNTLVLINTSATHRHPAYWPAPEAPRHGSAPYPVSSFNPGYWLQPQPGGGDFLRPQPGSFVPFSEGGRGCLGRQFAMVELCAQLAGIFSDWSVELVQDGTLGWEGAKVRAEQVLSEGVVFDMTLRPTEMVPVRFVRREAKTGPKPLVGLKRRCGNQ